MRTAEDESLDIGIELHEILLYHRNSFRSIILTPLDSRNEVRCCYLLNMYSIVMKMYSVFIGSDIDRRLGRENTYFSVSSLEYFLGTRYRDSEDFSVRKVYLLEVLYSMSGCCVAGEYDDSRTLVEEELYSFFRIFPYSLIISVAIGTACIVTKIAVIVLR